MSLKKISAVCSLLPLVVLRLFAPAKKVGGQAIIEGVMMRGKQNVSWAVRKADGTMIVEKLLFVSAGAKTKALRLPVFRGAVGLYESLVLGYKALSRSAEIAMEEERAGKPDSVDPKKQKLGDKLTSIASIAVALVVSIGLFEYGPMWLVSKFVPKESALLFNTFAGSIRIALFLVYLYLISRWKDMRRIFEYHGAEHKAIFTYEDGKDLTLENMRPYTTLHPRCGTSFLLLTGIVCILLFAIIDALFISLIGPYPSVAVRVLVHLVLVPLVAGCSYEVLKLSDRYKRVPVVGALILPGLWLQKITTKPPDDGQLEVASAALKAVL
jgi:uncharacterized protein YqhQ